MVSSESEVVVEGGKNRVLGRFPRAIIVLNTIVLLVLAIIYTFSILIAGRAMQEVAYLYLMIALMMPVAFLVFPAHPSHRHRLPWYDILLATLSFAIPFYFSFHIPDIYFRAWELALPLPALMMAFVFWAITLEACRRAISLPFSLFVLFASLYPLWAMIPPGIWKAPSYSLERLASYYMAGPDSIRGIPVIVVGKLLIGFFFFACVLIATGAGNAFMLFALSLLGHVRGGAAKVAVLSSAMMGSISGSVVTNVITTGSVTIPAMKRTGYASHYAAAIETCASTGGVLMPPVMGGVAFVMAGFLNIPYIHVAIAAVIPSILYYISLLVQADGYAAKTGLKGLPKSELPTLWQGIKEISIYAIAIFVLIWLLLYLRREGQAPYYASAFLFVIAALRKSTRLGFKDYVAFIERAGRLVGELMPIMIGVGLVIGAIFITNLGDSFSVVIITTSAGNIALLILFGAITSFILGIGLTVTACYVLLAIVLAPALVESGLNVLSVHLFIMYCGMLSFITPPVAIGAYAAAALAGSKPMQTGLQAMKLGAVIFVIPVFFVLNPALILQGTPLEIIQAIATSIPAVILIASGIEGYLIGMGRLALVPRAVTLISGALLFYPSVMTQIIGAGMIISLVIALRLGRRFVTMG